MALSSLKREDREAEEEERRKVVANAVLDECRKLLHSTALQVYKRIVHKLTFPILLLFRKLLPPLFEEDRAIGHLQIETLGQDSQHPATSAYFLPRQQKEPHLLSASTFSVLTCHPVYFGARYIREPDRYTVATEESFRIRVFPKCFLVGTLA